MFIHKSTAYKVIVLNDLPLVRIKGVADPAAAVTWFYITSGLF